MKINNHSFVWDIFIYMDMHMEPKETLDELVTVGNAYYSDVNTLTPFPLIRITGTPAL